MGLVLLLVPPLTRLAVVLLGDSFAENVGVRTFLVVSSQFAVFFFSFRRNLMDALICAIGALLMQNMAAVLQDILDSLRGVYAYSPLSFTCLISIACVYTATWFLCCRNLKGLANISLNRGLILGIAILSYLLVSVIFMFGSNLDRSDITFILYRALIFFCDFLTLFAMFAALKQKLAVTESMMMEQLLEETERKFRLDQETIEVINIKCHDLKHRLEYLRPVDEKDEKSIEEMEKAVLFYENTPKTQNAALDVVLSNKALLCEKKGIQFTHFVEGQLLSFMGATDIACLFGNALDNAIEYLSNLDEEKRILFMSVHGNKHTLGIHIENYCDETLRFQDGLPMSTKGDKFYHGFGLRSIRHIVEKYDGNIVVSVQDCTFVIDITIPFPASVQT